MHQFYRNFSFPVVAVLCQSLTKKEGKNEEIW
jgi:hypothetical protein